MGFVLFFLVFNYNKPFERFSAISTSRFVISPPTEPFAREDASGPS